MAHHCSHSRQPWLGALKGNDAIDLPAFQQLRKSLDPGNVVRGRESETVPDVEIAVAIFRARTVGVLGEEAKAIQGTVVKAMCVCVTER